MRPAILAVSLIACVVLVTACSRREPRSTTRAPTDTTRAVRKPAPSQVPLPAHVTDLLPEWFADWKTVGFTLRPDSLFPTITERFRASTYRLDLESAEMVLRRPFLIWSPDSLKAVDPYATFELTTEKGRTRIAGRDVDVAVNVIDLKTGSAFQALSCGTPCDYHDAAWVDGNTFIVVGTDYLMPGDGSNRGTTSVIEPVVYVVSLRDSTFTVYSGPHVNGETYSRARIARYQGLKLDRLFPE